MGWKCAFLIMHRAPAEAGDEALLGWLGFDNLKPIEPKPFGAALDPGEGVVYIGRYRDNLLLCAQDFVMPFFAETVEGKEKQIARRYPDSELCVIVLNSVVDLWAYAVSRYGTKLRARAGSDEGMILNKGALLDQEKVALQAIGADAGTFDDRNGASLAFAVSGRYFGTPMDANEELLRDTMLRGYTFETVIATIPDKRPAPQPVPEPARVTTAAKPWWRFW